MANQLINQSNVGVAQAAPAADDHAEGTSDMARREKQPDPRPIPRCMLYNEHGGKVFTGEEAIEAALDDGYQDEPLAADQLAQAPAADNSQQVIQELNGKLVELNDELSAAKKSLAEETARADKAVAAEQKTAAALKKAKGNAGK